MRILLTGGAGFIGHHVVDYFLRNTDDTLTLIDRLDTSGNLNRLAEIGAANNPRVRFFYHDLRAPLNDQICKQLGVHDAILHLAAGTHVDRSIEAPLEFVYDNVVATCNILDYARKVGCEKFLYFSTDEVFGPAPAGVAFDEDAAYRSGNPYAATKAGGEELAIAYANTYKLPVIVTHTMNAVGFRQHKEKYVPGTIGKILRGETVQVHADSTCTVPGSRFYIDAADIADGIRFVVRNGSVGEKYNLVGARETDNLEMAALLAAAIGKPLNFELVSWHASRPGHDLRYALSGKKLARMGWAPPTAIEDSLARIVEWSAANPQWL